jgi:AcrR family transcriptional regulator
MLRPASDQRRRNILDAVVRVIIDVGFTDMTVADVARTAGVSTALVHYHFSSKSELIEAALRVASADDMLFRDTILLRGGTVLSRLDAVLCDSLPVDADDASWLLWIETWGETRRSDGLRAVMSELDAHENDAITRLIDEGVAAGEFTCPASAATASRLTAARDGLAIDHTLFHRDLPAGTVAGQLRQAIAHELGLDAGSYPNLDAARPAPV